ncbi:MAG: hypothetical protein ABI867_21965 [Kofleriaceae bacterium]
MARFLMCLMWIACGSPASGGDDDDDDVPVDAPPVTTLDPADCTPIAQNFIAGATMCGTPLPSNAQAQLESVCRKGIKAASTCGGNPTAGFDCFVTQDASDWVCAAGQPFPACDGDLGASLGMYCVMALGNPACASGIKCEFDADCGGAECNGATGECFDPSAFCVGLPCEFDADCPNGETCNGAEHACVGN